MARPTNDANRVAPTAPPAAWVRVQNVIDAHGFSERELLGLGSPRLVADALNAFADEPVSREDVLVWVRGSW